MGMDPEQYIKAGCSAGCGEIKADYVAYECRQDFIVCKCNCGAECQNLEESKIQGLENIPTIQSKCIGFQYFTYNNQKVNTTHYTLDLINGLGGVTVTSILIGDNSINRIVQPIYVPAGSGFQIIMNIKDMNNKKGDSFSYNVYVTYDVLSDDYPPNTIKDLTDSGTCSGIIQ